MRVFCIRCGRTLAEITPPAFGDIETKILGRTLSGFGLDAGPAINAVLNPTPESICETFQVTCPGECPEIGRHSADDATGSGQTG